jgi:hypothetical protein
LEIFVLYEIPLPGIPRFTYVPRFPRVTVAPLRPADTLTPLLLKFSRTPGNVFTVLRNLNPMADLLAEILPTFPSALLQLRIRD